MHEQARKRKLDAIVHAGSKSVPTHAPSGPQHLLPPYGRFSLGRPSGTNEDAWEARSLSVSPGGDASTAGSVHIQLFGVYDGHGGTFGAAVSAHIAKSLHQHFCQHMRQSAAAAVSSDPGSGHAADGAIQAALVHAFEQTDRDLLHQPLPKASMNASSGVSAAAAAQLPSIGSGSAAELRLLSSSNAGSTATVAAITQSAIYLAWAGDSRAVVLGNGRTLAHTLDHKAEREDEQDRIAAAGGRVFFNSGLRVMGMLATTRAIGDHDLRPYGVVPTPDVVVVPRTGEEEYLVLASDGLWDVVSSEEVYNYASKTLQKVEEKHAGQLLSKGTCCACQAAGIAARALTYYARNKRHSRDDITVLVVNLHTPCACPKPTGAHYTSNSSVLSRAPGQHLQRSSSADGALPAGAPDSAHDGQQPQQLQQPVQPVGGASGSSAGCSRQQQQQPAVEHQQLSQQHMPQSSSQLQQQPGLACAAAATAAGGGGGAPAAFPGIVIQPSVCAARPSGASQRRPGLVTAFANSSACNAALRDAHLSASVPVSDLVMSSPFAGMLSSVGEQAGGQPPDVPALTSAAAVAAAAAAAAASAGAASGLAMSSGSAPASAGGASSMLLGDDIALGVFGSGCCPGRQVGSAPPDVMPGSVLTESLHHSLNFALGSGRSCGGLLDMGGSLSCPLGSAELPVAV